jgi:hypothetical protein
MKHTTVLFAALSLLSASVALAGPPKDAKKTDAKKPAVKTAKLTDVWTCPVTGETIANHKTENGTPAVVGNYKVHFCCAGCDGTFAKLSDKDKQAKAEAAHKKDIAKTETGDKKGKS